MTPVHSFGHFANAWCEVHRKAISGIYEAADIAMQPDSRVMLTPSVEPDLAAMTALGSPCRECVSWHKPYFLRLLLAQWEQITERNAWRKPARRASRVLNNKTACGVITAVRLPQHQRLRPDDAIAARA